MIQLILSAPVPAMASAFERAFEAMASVTVHRGPFETLSDFDCMVSAANSFGLMDGGVDAAITAYFGTQLQQRVQQHILSDWLGEQPVGTAFTIETGNPQHPWLVHAPTMRAPLTIDGTDAVYNATRAALLAIRRHNLSATDDNKIRSAVFPAMGAGCGQVPPESVAAQMKLAWLSVVSPAPHISWQQANARHKAVFETTAYCPGSTVCPQASTRYIGCGDYRTSCARTGQPCISPKHQSDDVFIDQYLNKTMSVSYDHSIRADTYPHVFEPGSHSHSIHPLPGGKNDL